MDHGSSRLRSVIWLAAVAVLVLVGTAVAVAQETELGGKIQAGDRIVISSGETFEGDLYASGGEVRIDGTVTGDLVAAAGQVTITGLVEGDVIASGGRVEMAGEVVGDVRAAGGQLRIGGTIGEDLFAAGGQVVLVDGGEVGEDLVFGSGQMTLAGAVAGDVLGTAGNYERSGTVGGTENVTIAQDEQPTFADRILTALQRFVSILLVASLILWLAPRFIEGPAEAISRRPLAAFGAGLLALLGFIVLLVVVTLAAALVTVGAALVGLGDLVASLIFATIVVVALLVLLLVLAALFGAPAWVGLALGRLGFASDSRARSWLALAMGVVLVAVLVSLPVVGGLVALVVLAFGLGGLALTLVPRWRVRPSSP